MINKIVNLVFIAFLGLFSNAQNTDVWDFGAAQLDNSSFNNLLNENVINSWYDSSITPGSVGTSNTMPTSFSVGALSWTGAASDRLRTTNTNITRFDANVASVSSHQGRVYCNGNAAVSNGLPTTRYFSLLLNEDDEVTIIARGDTQGLLTFLNVNNPQDQTDTFVTTATSGSVTEVNFVAKTAGNYRFFDATAKASIYRVYRKDAVYTTVSGNINLSQAPGIPANYSLVFTNLAGKSWTAEINSGVYEVTIPVGYSYELSLVDANGYVISSGNAFSSLGVTTLTTNHDIAIANVSLFSVTGSISGLGANIQNLSLNFIPLASSETIFVPIPVIDFQNATYSVQLEANVSYTIEALGVNDFEISNNTISALPENSVFNISFTEKPKFPVSLNITGLNTTQLADLVLIFTNLNEENYQYSFSDLENIELRNGVYAISFSGMDVHPVQLGLVSNLNVNNNAVSKTLNFSPVNVWSFDDQSFSTTTQVVYKGMILSGQVSTVIASGHLTAKTGATIQVPVTHNNKVIVSYYYTANFSIEGGETITTNTNSTSIIENVSYVYNGTSDGFVTITVGGASSLTSYFTEIKVVPNIVYAPIITVGVDKNYQTINEALHAVSLMERPENERVVILIDSGNYEEMLVIDQPNVTLKNAAVNPNIDLIENGVQIADGAVRITSYYGHGYHYFSMGSNQKWNQDVLNVNLENGTYSHNNAGAGTTNGSFWNATVVVRANGFIAEGIIFENSFNQYISNKESQDVVVAWASGSPGVRPTSFGNVEVQNRIFVERAAAIAFPNNTDKAILNKCRVVGRQDTFFGGHGSRVVVYKGAVMGAVDFIFGGMNAVFYQTQLTMNTSDQSNDVSYITAAQQLSGRGYLMYECTVNSAIPSLETASVYRSKPGYFGRPWQATTSEVVFFNTTIETSNYPSFVDNSLILPLGWQSSLGGTSSGMYEYGTVELSGVNNIASRASWSTSLQMPLLNDQTEISTFNFTKGTDNWDPLPELIANDVMNHQDFYPTSLVHVYALNNQVFVENVTSKVHVQVFDLNGKKIRSFQTYENTSFTLQQGIWIVNVNSDKGTKSIKVISK